MNRCPYCWADLDAGVARSWSISIKGPIPNQNQFKGQHRFAYAKVRDQWADILSTGRDMPRDAVAFAQRMATDIADQLRLPCSLRGGSSSSVPSAILLPPPRFGVSSVTGDREGICSMSVSPTSEKAQTLTRCQSEPLPMAIMRQWADQQVTANRLQRGADVAFLGLVLIGIAVMAVVGC